MKTKFFAALLSGLFLTFHTKGADESFGGIGVHVDIKDKALTITYVHSDSPAGRAGLTPGLVIRKIDDTDVKVDPTVSSEANLRRYAAMIRGAAGTKVTLELAKTKSKRKTTKVELTRVWFDLAPVTSLEPAWR